MDYGDFIVFLYFWLIEKIYLIFLRVCYWEKSLKVYCCDFLLFLDKGKICINKRRDYMEEDKKF